MNTDMILGTTTAMGILMMKVMTITTTLIGVTAMSLVYIRTPTVSILMLTTLAITLATAMIYRVLMSAREKGWAIGSFSC